MEFTLFALAFLSATAGLILELQSIRNKRRQARFAEAISRRAS